MAVEVAKDQLRHGTISINVTGLASPHTKSNLKFYQKQIVPLSAFIRNHKSAFCVTAYLRLCVNISKCAGVNMTEKLRISVCRPRTVVKSSECYVSYN